MRAMLSSSALEMGCRTEQFVALRYIGRHLEMDAAVGSAGLDDGFAGGAILFAERGAAGCIAC